jgi:hypothetical protein
MEIINDGFTWIEAKILFVNVFFFYIVLYIAKVSVGEAIVCILIYVYHVLKVL